MKKLNSVSEELRYLVDKNQGIINPHDVVEFAKNPETHLHSKFEWDDRKAAQSHRVWQARQLIKLELEVIKVNEESKNITYFVSLKNDRKPGGGYRETATVLHTKTLREQLLDQALGELIRIRIKYAELTELTAVFEEIEKLEKKQESKQPQTVE